MQQNNIYVVLGMARSGTSVMARALQALGVDLGNEFVPTDIKWNAKGFFEDNEIVYGVNSRATALLDCADGIIFAGQEQQLSAGMDDIRERAVSLVKSRFQSTRHWAFKDPRTVKIMTFWQRIFSDLQLNEHYLIAVRNPIESAQSYAALARCDVEHALLLWFMHSMYAIEDTQQKNRVVVSYELLMQQPREQLQRIKQKLNIPDLVDQSEIELFTNQFLDKSLQHYATDDLRLVMHEALPVVPLCIRLYRIMLQLARDELAFDSEAFYEAWRDLKRDFAQIYPIYQYLDKILKKNKQQERTLRSMTRSIPWKMLYPLRWISDRLRSYRKKNKFRRRLAKLYA